MTINTQTNTTTVLGNGSQTQFTFGFIGVAAAYMSVISTDADGNETILTSGSGANQYQISLNAPVTGALWGLGGTVTYNPNGSPIASGTTLTIFRTLPLTQAISLQNLISLATLGNGAEMGLDTIEMQLQQVSEMIGRSIVAPIVDPPTINLTLPAAAQRANTGLAFDSQGNVIAGTTPATGLISTAMQPVVDAASLALGRTAFGLGVMATEGIGAGLQDDGSGNARVFFNLVADATNQSVTSAFHLTQRVASAVSLSAPLIYTLPRANTLFNAFGFWVFALTGNVEITPNANDNFDGLATGVSVAVPQGSWAWITTNAASSGTWHIDYSNQNMALQASVTSSTLVITLNATAIAFRDPTLTNGDQIWQNIPANLTLTVPNGATLGTSNGIPCRVYVFLAYNGGSPVLGVALASTQSPIRIYPIASWETQQVTGALISTGSDSAGTLYTSAAAANTSVKMIGYVEFSGGQATAGVWNTSPSVVQVMGPGIKKPGEVVQGVVAAALSGQASISSTSFGVVSNSALSAFSMQSACNLIRYTLTADITVAANPSNNTSGTVSASRASTLIGPSPVMGVPSGGGGTGFESNVPFIGYDAPGVTSSLTYQFQAKATGTGAAVSVQSINGQVEEIVG